MKAHEIAKSFVDNHKDSNLGNWQPFGVSESEKLNEIYHSLIAGVYGEVSNDNGFSCVEISAVDRADKKPFIFEFDYE